MRGPTHRLIKRLRLRRRRGDALGLGACASFLLIFCSTILLSSPSVGGSPFTKGTVTLTSAPTWTKLHPANPPGPRSGASLVYDAKDGYVLAFGGTSSAGNLFNQTWTYASG